MNYFSHRPLVLISACLAGRVCRYDGTACTVPELAQMVETGLGLAVCPEELGGLSCPRLPAEIRQGRVVTQAGQDVSLQFERGAELVLALAWRYNIGRAILKAHSPSCGKDLIYDGTFSRSLVPGQGVTAAKLRLNGIRVYTENNYGPCLNALGIMTH